MFTGIVEKSVRVLGVAVNPGFRRITLACDWKDVRLGQSVAVNGCCLTIAQIGDDAIGFDVVPETLDKTNLGLLESGSLVHVERSLCVGDRLDGHFVQGHVDGRAVLLERIDLKEEVRIKMRAPDALAKYLVPKGSVSLDGVSLTIAAVNGAVFEAALIPTTLNITQLDRRQIGWPYNLEADVVAKTIVSWLENSQGRGPREEQRTT
jgi:riboflavin synthase